MNESNYDKTKRKMQKSFLEYDQDSMIERWRLDYDKDWIYIKFIGCIYRVSRSMGIVERKDGVSFSEANYNEAMTIYDVLCWAKPDCRLSGKFVPISSLSAVQSAGVLGKRLLSAKANAFSGKTSEMAEACEKLGGIRFSVADVDYQIPLFEFLPVRLQFWEADDEFPASLMILWDEDILDYMHFETTFYAANQLIERIMENMKH